MIENISFPMWTGSDLIGVCRVLSVIPAHRWEWRLLYFDGIAIPPGGMMMDRFTELIAQRGGYLFSWEELCSFTDEVHQVFDAVLVAIDPNFPVAWDTLARDEFDDCQVVIEASDSTEWSLGISTRLAEWESIYARWGDLAAHGPRDADQ